MSMINTPDTPKPHHQYNKSGYEIRESILALAKESLELEFKASLTIWELNDKHGDSPKPPTVDGILETAERLYKFVNTHPASSQKTPR